MALQLYIGELVDDHRAPTARSLDRSDKEKATVLVCEDYVAHNLYELKTAQRWSLTKLVLIATAISLYT
jgi:hypothetical protein